LASVLQTDGVVCQSRRVQSTIAAGSAAAEMSGTTDTIIIDTATRIFQDLCEPATVNGRSRQDLESDEMLLLAPVRAAEIAGEIVG
jgi:hypothetical protein